MSVGLRMNSIRTASIINLYIRHDNVFKLYSNRDTIAMIHMKKLLHYENCIYIMNKFQSKMAVKPHLD